MTFDVYGLAGLLMFVLLWVCLQRVTCVVMATRAGWAGAVCAAIWRARRFPAHLRAGAW